MMTESTEFEVYVSPPTGTFGYPYLALLMDEDAVYGYARKFLRFKTDDFSEFIYELPEDGVYEGRIQYRDRTTKELVKREDPWWFLLVGDAIFDIERSDVLAAVRDFPAMVDKYYGEGYWEAYLHEKET